MTLDTASGLLGEEPACGRRFLGSFSFLLLLVALDLTAVEAFRCMASSLMFPMFRHIIHHLLDIKTRNRVVSGDFWEGLYYPNNRAALSISPTTWSSLSCVVVRVRRERAEGYNLVSKPRCLISSLRMFVCSFNLTRYKIYLCRANTRERFFWDSAIVAGIKGI